MRTRFIPLLLFIVLIAAGAFLLHRNTRQQATLGDPPDTPPAPFDQLRASWADDLEGHRLEPSLARYSADATFIDPDGTHNEGAGEIRKLYTMVFAAYDSRIQFDSRTTEQSDILAYDSGSYTEDLTDRTTHKSQHLAGDYLTIYRYEKDGKWRIVQQVWTQAKAAPQV